MLAVETADKLFGRVVIGVRADASRVGGGRAARIADVEPVVDDNLRLQLLDHRVRRLLTPRGGPTIGVEPEQVDSAVIRQ